MMGAPGEYPVDPFPGVVYRVRGRLLRYLGEDGWEPVDERGERLEKRFEPGGPILAVPLPRPRLGPDGEPVEEDACD